MSASELTRTDGAFQVSHGREGRRKAGMRTLRRYVFSIADVPNACEIEERRMYKPIVGTLEERSIPHMVTCASIESLALN